MAGLMARPRFKSKLEALQSRVATFVCLKCDQHFDQKHKLCPNCHSPSLHYFPSMAEFNRFAGLKLLLRAGEIHELELQPSFPVVINFQKICTYKADFKYKTKAGETIIEDVKGSEKYVTDLFKLKKKLVEAVYGIEIKVTT